MKKSRFTDKQVVRMLREADTGKSVTDICREGGINKNTFYAWRKKYGGMETQRAGLRRRTSTSRGSLTGL